MSVVYMFEAGLHVKSTVMYCGFFLVINTTCCESLWTEASAKCSKCKCLKLVVL